jgi:mRNA interferase MazF
VVIVQGDIFWADMDEPAGSEAGYTRPVIIVQGNTFNCSRINSVVCIPLTSTVKWAGMSGAALLSGRSTGLDKDSVAQAHLITTLDLAQLGDKIGEVNARDLQAVFAALNEVLERP